MWWRVELGFYEFVCTCSQPLRFLDVSPADLARNLLASLSANTESKALAEAKGALSTLRQANIGNSRHDCD
jgi:hypothetical protein